MTTRKRTRIRVKTSGFRVVSDALDNAIVSAMNKTDKWCETPLSDAQRGMLAQQLVNYFWCAIEETGAEIE